VSDINVALVLADDSIPVLARLVRIQKKWGRRGISTPFFLTERYIASSLDTYPVEFLDMKSNYRVLHGKDVLADLVIDKEHLRLQCERELKSISLHVRRAYVQAGGDVNKQGELLELSFKRLFPLFRALLVLHERPVPKMRSETVSNIEVIFDLGASVLSRVAGGNVARTIRQSAPSLVDDYVKVIDTITGAVDTMGRKESET
jgi:hypothetical protein